MSNEPNLKQVYIADVDLDDIFHSGKLLDSAKELLDLQERYQKEYSNITFNFNKHNDTSLELHGYRTETEEEIKKRNQKVLKQQEEDYKMYIELKQRFEGQK